MIRERGRDEPSPRPPPSPQDGLLSSPSYDELVISVGPAGAVKGGSKRPSLVRSETGNHIIESVRPLPRTAMAVTDALKTPHFSQTLTRGSNLPKWPTFSGWMRQQAANWPHIWQARWVTVQIIRDTFIIKLKLSPGGRHQSELILEKKSGATLTAERVAASFSHPAGVMFELIEPGARPLLLQPIAPSLLSATSTPPSLVAALACFAWPPLLGPGMATRARPSRMTSLAAMDSPKLLHAILVMLGDIGRALEDDPYREASYRDELSAISTFGLVAVKVGDAEGPGSLSAHAQSLGLGDITVPAGVGRNSFFHVPKRPSGESPNATPQQLEARHLDGGATAVGGGGAGARERDTIFAAVGRTPGGEAAAEEGGADAEETREREAAFAALDRALATGIVPYPSFERMRFEMIAGTKSASFILRFIADRTLCLAATDDGGQGCGEAQTSGPIRPPPRSRPTLDRDISSSFSIDDSASSVDHGTNEQLIPTAKDAELLANNLAQLLDVPHPPAELAKASAEVDPTAPMRAVGKYAFEGDDAVFQLR